MAEEFHAPRWMGMLYGPELLPAIWELHGNSHGNSMETGFVRVSLDCCHARKRSIKLQHYGPTFRV